MAAPTHTILRVACDRSGTPTIRPTGMVGTAADLTTALVLYAQAPTTIQTGRTLAEAHDELDAALDLMTGGDYDSWVTGPGGYLPTCDDWTCIVMDLNRAHSPEPTVTEILLLVEVQPL